MANRAEQPLLAITGAGGLVGQILREGLGDAYRIAGFDRRRSDGCRRVNLARSRPSLAALRGADFVVDLAARASPFLSWREAHRNNIRTTFNVLEAARLAGARRVVYASSGRVTAGYERDEPYASIVAGRLDGLDPDTFERITIAHPVRPDGPYGLSKAFGEAAGRYFSEEHGLSVVCLRIGTVTREDQPRTVRQLATLLSHRDLTSLVACCLGAPEELRFGVYYGVSANTWRLWDIENARAELGYEPRDNAERWR